MGITMVRPTKYKINLTESENKKLQSNIRDKNTSKSIIQRCHIILELDENNPNRLTHIQISKAFGISKSTISDTVLDYTKNGLDSAITNKRNPNSNAPRKIDGRGEARVIELACSTPPEGFARWTLSLLTDHAKICLETPVCRTTIFEVLKNTTQTSFK